MCHSVGQSVKLRARVGEGKDRLCCGVVHKIGALKDRGSVICFGTNVPCPFDVFLYCRFVFAENMERRCGYRTCFWQDLGKM